MTAAPLRLGLIADTHGLLRPEAIAALAGVDLIVHAGDVGGGDILRALTQIKPTHAVSGNCDDRHDPMLARERRLAVGDLSLHVSHGDELGRPTAAALLARYDADLLVFGHTHRALEVRQGDRIVVNPGSAGPRRFSLPVTLMTLRVVGRDVAVQLHHL